jgi:gamma-glutamylcyclotransferase (GGCT)/AIG2-like uncharacterized protein YtfP
MSNDAILNTKSELRVAFKTLTQAQGFREEIAHRRLLNSATPDILQLDEKRGHLLFVYGSLKSPFPRHYLLKSAKAKFVAVGMTFMDYSLFYQPNRQDERFPVLLPPINGSPSGHVVGQLWMVYPQTIMDLDRMERNGVLYQRLRMQCQVISKPMDKGFQLFANVWPWAYMGMPSAWRPLIHLKDMEAIPRTRFFDETDREIYINWSMKHSQIPDSLIEPMR